jgi:SAM-dependent methyltransferase
VQAAYDALAPAYDLLTADYAYEPWLAAVERVAIEHGLAGRRVLDVACGTGKSFLPLLARGYEVTGCDLSPAMLERAAAKAPAARLLVADMRELPPLGEFDLVTCLDDSINYLGRPDELAATLRGVRRCLAPRGLAVWDANTPVLYRRDFARTWAIEDSERLVLWRGGMDAAFAPADPAHAVVDVFARAGGGWTRVTSRHEQRHWPAADLLGAARSAGLTVLAVHGQHHGARLDASLDEDVHPKALFVACRDDRSAEGGAAMRIGSP